jgi:hypothetical protein
MHNNNEAMSMKKNDIVDLEVRKQKEVEHSDRRRSIVTGFEYMTDASCGSNFEELVTDKEAYEKHFSNMNFTVYPGQVSHIETNACSQI